MINDRSILGEAEEPQLLMCVKVAQMRALYGSTRADCAKCRTAVWVSVSGQAAIKENPKLQICCMECATKEMQQSGEDMKFSVVPGAIEEMIRHFRKTGQN